jgi:hypothetical protein
LSRNWLEPLVGAERGDLTSTGVEENDATFALANGLRDVLEWIWSRILPEGRNQSGDLSQIRNGSGGCYARDDVDTRAIGRNWRPVGWLIRRACQKEKSGLAE